jgi:hypothetical protein
MMKYTVRETFSEIEFKPAMQLLEYSLLSGIVIKQRKRTDPNGAFQ